MLLTLPKRYLDTLVLSGALLLLMMVPLQAFAVEQNVAFLPLKINAEHSELLEQEADRLLEEVLAEDDFTLLSRTETAVANLKWPPQEKALQAIAEMSGFEYVATGSLTQLGETFSLDFSVYDVLDPAAPFTLFAQAVGREQLKAALAEAVTGVISFSNREITIVAISPEGNVRIDSGAILRKIKTKPGDVYDPARLREDLRAVFTMGYFDNVEIDVSDTPEGKTVVFRVEEKPLIGKVMITGVDKLNQEDVDEAANLPTNTIVNPARVNEAVERVLQLYRSKGFYNTEVTADISYPTPERAEVALMVEEGKKITIKEITFVGNTSFDADDLEDVIETNTYSWWISWLTEAGVLKEDVLKQDAARLGTFYQNQGFMEIRVGEPKVEEKEGDLYITFVIEEGPRYRVGTVDVQGDLVEEREALIPLLAIRQEEFLNRQVLREDMLRLTDLYAEHGYAFARVSPDIAKSEEGKRVDVIFDVDQGPLVYFNRVEIRGNTRTRDNVIRRDLKVKEGGVFDAKAIRESAEKLQRLGFFEDVKIHPEPTLQEDQMDVFVDIKERPTGQFSIGAGYSSTENVMFMGEITEKNFLGTGNRLTLSANISGTTTRYNLNFTNPRLFDTQLSAGVDLYNYERKYDDYTRHSTGGGLRFGHPFIEKWRLYYGYTLEKTDLIDIKESASRIIVESEDIHWTSKVNLALVRDTRNSSFVPDKGSRNRIAVYHAGGFLGGDASFTKVEASSSWYFPLILKTTLHIKLAAGKVWEGSDGKLPVYEHFYLGGMNSIRGFDSYSISPVDVETGEKIGGDKRWNSTISIIFPLFEEVGIKGEVFTDFGNVYGVDEDWDFSDYKKTAGVGFYWLSPLGPLRLAWGYNLDKQEGENSSNWDFSIGGVF